MQNKLRSQGRKSIKNTKILHVKYFKQVKSENQTFIPRPEFTFLHLMTSVAQKTQNLRTCKMSKNKTGKYFPSLSVLQIMYFYDYK